MKTLIALALFFFSSPLWAANIYVAQSSAGGNTGADCSNARALSTLASGDWVAGNTIHLCGTVTFSGGSAGLVAQGSGTSGSPIIVKFETNAILQSPYFGTTSSCYSLATCTAAIEVYNYNNIIIDGGTNGVIQNTANGTNLANYQASAGVILYGSNLIVRNLSVQNIYVNDPSKNDTHGTSTADISVLQGSTNVTLCNNVLGQARAGISSQGSGGSAPSYPFPSCAANTFTTGQNYFGNTLTDHAWTFLLGQGSGATASTYNIFRNVLNYTLAWVDSNDDFHNDGLMVYGTPQSIVYAFNNTFEGTFLGTASIYCTYGSSGSGSSCFVFNNLFELTSDNSWGVAFVLGSSGDGYNLGPHLAANNTMIHMGLVVSGTNTGATSKNNLMDLTTSSGSYFYLNATPSTLTGSFTASDYNSFYGGRGLSFTGSGYWCWPQSGGSPSGCGSSNNGPWVNTGFDTHSISANPLVDANYKLTTGSPDIGTGANLTSLCSTIAPLCYDAAGVARPASGAWDIGAYQYQPSVYRVLGSHMLGGGRTVQ